ncbi:MAG: cysteine desulfurase NifS [Clostridiaceae bacterium]|nr:cysteine desulfurase NifS [Clostridiaceae bacterium]
MQKQIIYFDHAATTYVKPEVFEAMKPYFTQDYGNPSSIYSIGRSNRKAVEDARISVARSIGAAEASEIYFTGSGTESDNWAIKGAALALRKKGRHIITSNIEHPAVMATCEFLKKEGYDLTILPVDSEGLVNPDDVDKAIRPDTILVTIMMANNEIGTIQPIKEIAQICKKHGVLFHSDAVQAAGNIPIDVKDLGVDLLSVSGHKFYGPKGTGMLYIRKGVRIENFIHGGHQERNKRAGTENVPGIVGFAKALELAIENMDAHTEKLLALRDRALKGITERIPYVRVNGSLEKRLPGNLNISFRFVEGESVLLMLDMKGIKASSGSACTSGSLDPSHVLLAIGLPHEIAHGSLRLSFGEINTVEEVDYLIDCLVEIMDKLRNMSPLYEDFVKGENKNV